MARDSHPAWISWYLEVRIPGQTCLLQSDQGCRYLCTPKRAVLRVPTPDPSLPDSCLLSCLYWSPPVSVDPNLGILSLQGVERMEGPGLS